MGFLTRESSAYRGVGHPWPRTRVRSRSLSSDLSVVVPNDTDFTGMILGTHPLTPDPPASAHAWVKDLTLCGENRSDLHGEWPRVRAILIFGSPPPTSSSALMVARVRISRRRRSYRSASARDACASFPMLRACSTWNGLRASSPRRLSFV